MNSTSKVSAFLILATIVGATIGAASAASAKSISGASGGSSPAKTGYIAKEVPRSFMMGAMRAALIGEGGKSGAAGAAGGAGKGGRLCPPMAGVCISAP